MSGTAALVACLLALATTVSCGTKPVSKVADSGDVALAEEGGGQHDLETTGDLPDGLPADVAAPVDLDAEVQDASEAGSGQDTAEEFSTTADTKPDVCPEVTYCGCSAYEACACGKCSCPGTAACNCPAPYGCTCGQCYWLPFKPELPEPRDHPWGFLTSDGVVLVGGTPFPYGPYPYEISALRWKTGASEWSKGTLQSPDKFDPGFPELIVPAGDFVLVFRRDAQNPKLSDWKQPHLRYHLVNDEMSKVDLSTCESSAVLTPKLHSAPFAWAGQRVVLVEGDSDGWGWNGKTNKWVATSLYDPVSNTWDTGPPPPTDISKVLKLVHEQRVVGAGDSVYYFGLPGVPTPSAGQDLAKPRLARFHVPTKAWSFRSQQVPAGLAAKTFQPREIVAFPEGILVLGVKYDSVGDTLLYDFHAAVYWEATDTWTPVNMHAYHVPSRSWEVQGPLWVGDGWLFEWVSVTTPDPKKEIEPPKVRHYNPYTDQWTVLEGPGYPTDHPSWTAKVFTGKEILLLGGSNGPGNTQVVHKDGTKRWRPAPP